MKNRIKLITFIASFCLVFVLGVIGVFSVTKLDFSIGGIVTFSAEGLLVEVGNGRFETTSGEEYPGVLPTMEGKMQGFVMNTDKTMTSPDIVQALKSWTNLDMTLSPKLKDCVLAFDVTNNMDVPVSVGITPSFDETNENNKNMRLTATSGQVPAGQTLEFTITFNILNENINARIVDFNIEVIIDYEVEVPAAPVTDFEVTYTENESNKSVASITSYIGGETTVVVPKTIVKDGVEYTVTEIADGVMDENGGVVGAFSGNTIVENLTIPASITRIGDFAFAFCPNLTQVTIGEGVESVGMGAFAYCPSLEDINGADSLISIATYAFMGCESLENVVLGEKIEYLGDGAFADCTALKTVEIADNFTRIPDSTFSGCTSLNNVTLPEGLESIGESAFQNCSSLTTIKLPSTLTTISPYAFKNCTALKSIEIPSKVKSLQNIIFSGCSSLEEVILSEGLEEINTGVFWHCAALKTINLPSTLTRIGNSAFNESGLESITIPANVSVMEGYAFAYCKELTSVTFAGNSLQEIPEHAFDSCTKLQSITIPSSVLNIQAGAFANCTMLANVVLQEGLQTISREAFMWCSALSIIKIPSTVNTDIGYYAFHQCNNLATVVIDSLTLPSLFADNNNSIGMIDCATTVYIKTDAENVGTYLTTNFTNVQQITTGEYAGYTQYSK